MTLAIPRVGFLGSSAGKESACKCRRPWFNSWVRKIPWRRDRLPTSVFLGFPCGSAGKESAYNVGDLGSIPGLGRSPGEGKGYLLQCSGLENSMDYTVHGITKSQTRLSDSHFTTSFTDQGEVDTSVNHCRMLTSRWFRNHGHPFYPTAEKLGA